MRLPTLRRPRIRLVTWNVWFGLTKPHRRWTELLRIVGSLRADVIGFQEVTPPFLDMLRSAAWVKKGYTISDPRGESIDAYGTVMLTRLPVHEVWGYALPSDMGRTLVVVETEVAGARWAMASTHLESLTASEETRGRQLEKILSILGGFPDVAFMGDFNFCSSWRDEQARLPREYADGWASVRGDDGFTVDSDANAMRRAAKPDDLKRVRFDRVLIRSERAAPVKARLLGTRPIRGEAPALFPSDHFGVMVDARLSSI